MRDTITLVRAVVLTLMLTGCSVRPRTADPLIITGPTHYVDSTGPMAGQTTVVVVVRSSSNPEMNLGYAIVVLEAPGRQLMGVRTGPDGVAHFDTVAVGTYSLRAQRIGYDQHTISLTARESCTQRVEIYLKPRAMCLFECPQIPSRATITTCPPAA